MQVVLAQMKNPAITNEDVRKSALKFVPAISKLVKAGLGDGRVEELGGGEVVQQFFDSVKVRISSLRGTMWLMVLGT
jgi:hypothetical protein